MIARVIVNQDYRNALIFNKHHRVSGADTGFHHGGRGGFLASLLSLPSPGSGGSGVLPPKILKFYIAVGEFECIFGARNVVSN